MTDYITDKFNKFVFTTVKKLNTNDDLYDECTKLIERNKHTDKLTALINSVAYAEIAYRFRLKKLEKCAETHGTYYLSYAGPVQDAMHQLLIARDNLMDYCVKKRISYLNLLQ